MTSGFVFLKLKQGSKVSPIDVAEEIAKKDGVDEVLLISGEWHILVRYAYEKMSDLSKFVVDELESIGDVGETDTIIVLDKIK